MIKPRLHHFVMLAVFFVILIVSLIIFATHTEAYEESELFARQDRRIFDLVGKVVEVRLRFWDGFEFTSAGSGGEASFVMDVFGDNRKAVMDIRLHRAANRWYEDVVYIRVNGDSELHTIYGEHREIRP
jgi:hypothetical protein